MLATRLLIGIAFALTLGCRGSQQPERWEPYTGCNDVQCQSWFEACRADCLNEGGTVGDCQTQCRAKQDACLESCS